MRYVTGAIAVLLCLLVLVFSFQNREAVNVSFLSWSMSLPKIFLILGTYVLGMATGTGLVAMLKRAF
jgi:uncharacterized integral membrane protein